MQIWIIDRPVGGIVDPLDLECSGEQPRLVGVLGQPVCRGKRLVATSRWSGVQITITCALMGIGCLVTGVGTGAQYGDRTAIGAYRWLGQQRGAHRLSEPDGGQLLEPVLVASGIPAARSRLTRMLLNMAPAAHRPRTARDGHSSS